ncbi:MAG: hypothetical protein K6G90_00060 [Clostridia bacterium]|nr:hypothetical protein [Clostridia bacterium]
MKKLFKIMAVVLAIGLILAVNAAPAFAAGAYTAVAGGTTTFEKYLAVEAGSSVPNKTFDFSIAAGEAVPATASSMAVLAGIGTPTITDPAFTNSDPTDAVANASATDDVALTAVASQLSGMDYAQKTVTVDFSSVSFPEPGIYRYVITEAEQTAPYSNVDARVKYMDVYVVDAQAKALSENVDPADPSFPAAGTLVVDSYILHADPAAPELNTTGGTEGDDVDDSKTDGFVNKYETVDLGFSKRISGNQAAKDKYFKFTVTLTENTVLVGDTDVFAVEITGAEAAPTANAATTYTSMTNPTEVTGAQLKAGVDFYLNDGQYVLIKDLPKGIEYEVVEDEEDYNQKAQENDVQGDGTYDDEPSSTLDGDVYVGYENEREGTIPTGVILTVAPFMIGLLVFGAVMMFVISRRRRAAY